MSRKWTSFQWKRSFNIAAALLFFASVWPEVAEGQEVAPMSVQETLSPDRLTRSLAARIKEAEVSHLSFYGPQIGCFTGEPIKVTDSTIIHRFVHALRVAMTRPLPIGNRINVLEIHYKHVARHQRQPDVFRFNTVSTADCYGPEFQASLRALGQLQARQVREEVRRIAPSVFAIEIATLTSSQHIRVSDAPQVKSLLSELERIDGRAFAFVDQGAAGMPYPVVSLYRIMTPGIWTAV